MLIDLFRHSLSESQVKYVRAIIIKNITIGATKTSFMAALSNVQNSDALFDAAQVRVIERIFNQKFFTKGVDLFTPVPVMLSKSMISIDEAVKQILKVGPGSQFYSEEKYDGERLQV
jgi:ATP-dependent DNA ligase